MLQIQKGLFKFWLPLLTLWLIFQALPLKALSDDSSDDSVIYGTYAAISMGNPGEVIRRDFYLTLGSKEGGKVGSRIEVYRKIPTHDLMARKLQKDMMFPIATLKIIHVEHTASIARLEKITAEETTPAITPRAVMVGDLVRLAR